MSDAPLDFTGKVVLVTGGATGIGRASSLAFARQAPPSSSVSVSSPIPTTTGDLCRQGRREWQELLADGPVLDVELTHRRVPRVRSRQ